jgi:hypothetical protein
MIGTTDGSHAWSTAVEFAIGATEQSVAYAELSFVPFESAIGC